MYNKTNIKITTGTYIATGQINSPIKYIALLTIYEVASQNNIVFQNSFLLNSALALATVAKQGIVNILNAIKDIRALGVAPVLPINNAIASLSELLNAINDANKANVETTFSLAISPTMVAVIKPQPNPLN